MKKYLFASLITVLLLQLGCSTQAPSSLVSNEANKVREEIQQYAQQAKAMQALADKKKQAQEQEAQARKNKEKRFSIKAASLDAALFFSSLMAGSGHNIVTHPEVKGKISLDLRQVTLDEALDVVRDIYGFDYQYRHRTYTIYPNKPRTEIFPINYINIKRVGSSDTSVLTGSIEGGDGGSSGNSGNSGSRIETSSETDFWQSLKHSLEELISINASTDSRGGQAKVVTNPQTGVVIVSAMPKQLSAVADFLEKARLSAKRQVIIEAKILEIQLNDAHQTGVNWNAINGQLLLTNNITNLNADGGIEYSESIGEVFSSFLRVTDIGTLLSLLKTQGEMQVLSSPRVSTVNNQKAVIRVGSDQYFVTGISSSTVSNAASTTTAPDIELTSFFSGISLDVTPQISEDDEVILHIHPVVSTVTEEQKSIVVGDSAFSLPLAFRDIRESDSIVKAKSGQVIVLGGLMQERVKRVKGKRPGLSAVPVAGELFKSSTGDKIKSELIILLKPVVVAPGAWAEDFGDSYQRFVELSVSENLSKGGESHVNEGQ